MPLRRGCTGRAQPLLCCLPPFPNPLPLHPHPQETGAVRKRPLTIFGARVPIIKCESADGVRMDICLNSGARLALPGLPPVLCPYFHPLFFLLKSAA